MCLSSFFETLFDKQHRIVADHTDIAIVDREKELESNLVL
jgi:hypothetical protein